MKSFVTRLISGIVLLAILITVILLGGTALFAFLLIISLIGMFELYRAAGIRKGKENALTIIAYLGAIGYYIVLYLNQSNYYFVTCVCAMIALLFVYVFSYPKFRGEDIATAFFGIVYVAVCLSFIYQVRNLPDGVFTVWLVIICSWGCDTMAYCTGMLFGKHKMAPVLSPKKSIEGAVGGVIGAALIGVIYAFVMQKFLNGPQGKILLFAVIGAVGGLISMVGDLAASAIKRNHDVKDYGKLIPGHGGILDRFDSVIITAPIIYLLAHMFQ